MPSFTTSLRTVTTVAVLALAANVGVASASAETHTPAKHKTAHVHKTHKKAHAKKPVARAANASESPTQPDGPSGTWTTIFDSEFTGDSLNTSQWLDHSGYVNQNNVTDHASNVSVENGDLVLSLSSATSGAAIESTNATLNVGDYVQASIDFAGSGSTIYNWPAFWTAGPGWPASGEQDIFEGAGRATVNYHSQVNGTETQAGPYNIPGTWSNGFHTYGIYRGTNSCKVYWDGKLVESYPTTDDGGPEYLILTMGANNPLAVGTKGQMLVSYVHEWQAA